MMKGWTSLFSVQILKPWGLGAELIEGSQCTSIKLQGSHSQTLYPWHNCQVWKWKFTAFEIALLPRNEISIPTQVTVTCSFQWINVSARTSITGICSIYHSITQFNHRLLARLYQPRDFASGTRNPTTKGLQTLRQPQSLHIISGRIVYARL